MKSKFKKISLRKAKVAAPDIRALAPANDDGLMAVMEKLAAASMEQVDQDREIRETTFLDMVPHEYRTHVEHIASTAYKKRGIRADVMPFWDFVQLIAKNWLIKRHLFFQIAEQFGFKVVSHFNRNSDAAAIALTRSASFVIISKPIDGTKRDILYGRIQERETTDIPPFQRSALALNLRKDARVRAARLNSSPVIDILVREDADLGVIHQASQSMTTSFGAVDRHTIWVVEGDKNGEGGLKN